MRSAAAWVPSATLARSAIAVIGVAVAVFFAVVAEGKSLEGIATPLSVIAKPAEAIFRAGGPAESAGEQ